MPPDISDESVMMRWMHLEISRINDGIVAERKTLTRLLREERPCSLTKGGKEHRYDQAVLADLEKKLTRDIQDKLLLPILFFFDSSVSDSAFLADGNALLALQALGELSGLRTMRDGRLWVGRAIVYSLIRKYPTVIQIAMR